MDSIELFTRETFPQVSRVTAEKTHTKETHHDIAEAQGHSGRKPTRRVGAADVADAHGRWSDGDLLDTSVNKIVEAISVRHIIRATVAEAMGRVHPKEAIMRDLSVIPGRREETHPAVRTRRSTGGAPSRRSDSRGRAEERPVSEERPRDDRRTRAADRRNPRAD